MTRLPSAPQTTHDVAIVGLGPVGITLCNLLGAYGRSVIGIDSASDVYELPRAIGMDHEVMRVFQNVGVADSLASVVSPYRPSEYRAADGRLLKRFESPPEPFPLAWPSYLTFLQPELERRLRQNTARYRNVSLEPATEVVALDNPDAPVLTLKSRRTEKTTTIRPRFVVGCDGGNSFVRRNLGITFEDLAFHEPWLVVDMLLENDEVDLPEVNIQFCNPARPHTYVVGPGRLRRWEFMILPGEDPAGLNTESRIWALLSPWLRPNEATLWRSATYIFHALVARQWRKGNVFLAGDACHMTPPFLAQGMVQGIKDAANLGWKLAHVLGGGADRLLDSYEAERRPLVKDVITVTKGLGQVICELDPVKARDRDDEMSKAVEAGQGVTIRQSLFPPIKAGLIATKDDGKPVAGAGQPCPQPWIVGPSERQRLDDVLDAGFALLAKNAFSIPPDLAARASALSVKIYRISFRNQALDEQDGVLMQWLENHAAEAVLVRPDHVVFGTAGTTGELGSLLEQLESQLAA